MKKTLIVLMMVLLASMLFISCDNKTSEPKPETPEPTTPTTPTKTTFTVTFDVNGGTGTVADKTTGTDGKVSKPEPDPKKTNAVFLYWSKDKSTEFNFETTALTEDTTLYAVWKTEFVVGDTGPAGGKIFYVADSEQTSSYVDSTGATQTYTWKYLEVAPSDITVTNGGTTTETFIFGYYFELVNKNYKLKYVVSENDAGFDGANAAIGQGRYNTTMLVNAMKDAAYEGSGTNKPTTDKYAAKLCTTYNVGDYSDWFLPSLAELKEVYNAYKDGKIGGTWHISSATGQVDSYWSSSEVSNANAYSLKFSDGDKWSGSRNKSYTYVRPVRAFL